MEEEVKEEVKKSLTKEEMEAAKLARIEELAKKRKLKAFDALLVKVTYVFTDFYVLKHGYLVSGNNETSCMIRLNNPEYMEYFFEVFGEFDILHIKDVRLLKRHMIEKSPYFEDIVNGYMYEDTETYHHAELFEEVKAPSIRQKVEKYLQRFKDRINVVVEWASFSEVVEEAGLEAFEKKFFKLNSPIEFQPKDDPKAPYAIIAKSNFPLVSEKNYKELQYSTAQIHEDVYNLLFYLEYDLFDVYMMYYYIPIEG